MGILLVPFHKKRKSSVSGCASRIPFFACRRHLFCSRILLIFEGSQEAPGSTSYPTFINRNVTFELVCQCGERNGCAIKRKKRRNTSRLHQCARGESRSPGLIRPAPTGSQQCALFTGETTSGNIGVLIPCERLRGPGQPSR